ncbi:hypothetical protein N7468_008808 [Penicillium chermesinum]|uniref:Methylated-DNA-[protein]-cysteine S-methyltransferase DNA binding domain-containing protein n=1 Tax=Penicillium chermesinum TaxID=63820 RepID=A0A9W9TEM6_9EURO|nr:uncharacterized protein N7468_008808 [Penicillium chermesinum]KAJ5219604.1 hypothetical protein N7468_008808 [Penicillium chermesinum]KAJ6153615.1 hypothetical protein N7470_006574 [Penicillium chermesinum]
MARSEEAEAWANAVYSAIQEIPPGRVTTYAHIALLLGEPQRPRQVGVCLKSLPDPESGLEFNSSTVPWQRVINAQGKISHRGPGSAERQAEALREEGVEITTGSLNEYHISFSRYGWFPKKLPSEEGGNSDDE